MTLQKGVSFGGSQRHSHVSIAAAPVLHKSKASRLLRHLVDGDVDVRDLTKLLKNRPQLPHILVPLHRKEMVIYPQYFIVLLPDPSCGNIKPLHILHRLFILHVQVNALGFSPGANWRRKGFWKIGTAQTGSRQTLSAAISPAYPVDCQSSPSLTLLTIKHVCQHYLRTVIEQDHAKTATVI